MAIIKLFWRNIMCPEAFLLPKLQTFSFDNVKMAIFQNFPKLRVDGCQYWTYKFKQLTKIIHKFYKKPVSNPLLMLEKSAMPMKVKRNSLAKGSLKKKTAYFMTSS